MSMPYAWLLADLKDTHKSSADVLEPDKEVQGTSSKKARKGILKRSLDVLESDKKV